MTDFTRQPPFPDALRTGGTREYLVDGVPWLVVQVAGHSYSAPWQGSIDDINDTGIKVDADGTERGVFWRPDGEVDDGQLPPSFLRRR